MRMQPLTEGLYGATITAYDSASNVIGTVSIVGNSIYNDTVGAPASIPLIGAKSPTPISKLTAKLDFADTASIPDVVRLSGLVIGTIYVNPGKMIPCSAYATLT